MADDSTNKFDNNAPSTQPFDLEHILSSASEFENRESSDYNKYYRDLIFENPAIEKNRAMAYIIDKVMRTHSATGNYDENTLNLINKFEDEHIKDDRAYDNMDLQYYIEDAALADELEKIFREKGFTGLKSKLKEMYGTGELAYS